MNLLIKLLYIFDRRDKLQALALFFIMLFGACFEALGIGLIMPFIALINNPEVVKKQSIFKWIYDTFGMDSYQEILIWSAGVLILIYVIKNFYLAFLYYVQYTFVFKKQVSLSRRLFDSYLSAPYTFHLNRNSAELLRNVNSEVLWIFHHVVIPVFIITIELMVIMVVLTMLLLVEPVSALVTIVVLGGVGSLFYNLTRKKIGNLGKIQQYYLEQMIKWVNQGLGAVKEANVLCRESFFVNTYTECSIKYSNATRFIKITSEIPRLFVEVIAVVGILLITIIYLTQGKNLQLILPTFGLFAMAAIRLMPSMNRILYSVTMLRGHIPSLNVVHRDLTLLTNKVYSPAKKEQQGGKNITFNQNIELRNVYYQYPEANKPVLKGISLSIQKGQSVAFVGHSGVGKTTVVDIILGLLKPAKGEVLVDGVNIHEALTSWQKKIGYIPQYIYLTDDTICNNIAFGIPEGIIDKKQVWSAIKAAQLEDLVNGLPDKLNTFVGEHGVRLSGGQRQRIGIARALYHNPEVLVMDEATSSLDNETENEITKAIERFSKEKTVIIIAHRLTTVKNCDCLFLMINGQCIDAAPYNELINKSNYFKEMAMLA